ncbi:MAG: GntR family transcriptional regulator [Nocardioidaceae bacterium]
MTQPPPRPPRSFDEFARERVVHMRAQRGRRTERRTSPRQAYEQLRSAIGLLGWEASEKLSEPRLVEELGLTRNSVRAALQYLASEGIITRQTRNGTRVALPLVQIPVDDEQPQPIVGSRAQPPVRTRQARHIVIDQLPDLGERYADATGALLIERELTIEWKGRQDVFGWQLAVFPLREDDHDLDPVSLMFPFDKHSPTPLGASFLRAFGVTLARRSVTVQARPCGPEMAARLHVEVGAPLLFRELVLADADDVVRRVTYTHLLGDRVALATRFA